MTFLSASHAAFLVLWSHTLLINTCKAPPSAAREENSWNSLLKQWVWMKYIWMSALDPWMTVSPVLPFPHKLIQSGTSGA